MKTIIVAFLLVISYVSLNVAKDSYLAKDIAKQGIEKPIKTHNFPVVFENSNEELLHRNFNTELFFSDLHTQQSTSVKVTTKTVDKSIETNNIPVNPDLLSSHYFPSISMKSNNEFQQNGFNHELFFSDINKQRTQTDNISAKAEIKSVTKTDTKVIRISNIPVNNGFLSSHFGFRKDPMHGSRRLHKGIDIAAKYGSPVNPLGKGEVVFSGYKAGYGNTVEIQHGKSVLSRYAHLKEFLVDEGQKVSIKDKIGLIGKTGRSTGPHLHLEVLFNGAQVDPQVFLANHFGSNSKNVQIATKPTVLKSEKKLIISKTTENKTEIKSFPKVKNFPQVSYMDYVKSVDGMFGLSAPESFSQ